MYKPSVYIIFFWLIFLLTTSACAGQKGYSWKKYEINTLLPENHIKQIERDKNGFYWIITVNGVLMRWNGSKSFRFFETVSPEGKKIDNFSGILRDGAGNLYLYSADGQTLFDIDSKSIPRYFSLKLRGNNFFYGTYGDIIQIKESCDAGTRGMGFGLRMVYLAAIKTDAELSLDICEKSVGFSVLFRKEV